MTHGNFCRLISPEATVLKYKGFTPSFKDPVFIAAGARLIGQVELGEYCSIWFNTVLRGDVHFIKVGSKTNIQDGSVVHCTHDLYPTTIGNNVTIGHSVTIHGCTIEDNCLVGMGATILDGAIIGEGSIVGANALVTQGSVIPPRSMVLGSPAKVTRNIKDNEYQKILESANNYVAYMLSYKE